MPAEALAQRALLRPAARQAQVQARVAFARGEEGVGEQVDALLGREAPGVEHADLAGQERLVAQVRVEAVGVDAAVPAADPLAGRCPCRRATASEAALGDSTRPALAVEGADGELRAELEPRVLGPQGGVGGELGVVAADHRQLDHPRDDRGGGARPGPGEQRWTTS